MRLGEIRKVATRTSGPAPHAAEPAPAAPAASRALIPIAPVADTGETPTVYRQAAFLAQLLAVKDQHPQTRERRRAEPEDAIAAYRAAAKLTKR
jgi:hypothetical protein